MGKKHEARTAASCSFGKEVMDPNGSPCTTPTVMPSSSPGPDEDNVVTVLQSFHLTKISQIDDVFKRVRDSYMEC